MSEAERQKAEPFETFWGNFSGSGPGCSVELVLFLKMVLFFFGGDFFGGFCCWDEVYMSP